MQWIYCYTGDTLVMHILLQQSYTCNGVTIVDDTVMVKMLL